MQHSSQSREVLTAMDSSSVASPSVGFMKKDGYFVSKKVAIFISVFFLSAVMSTALLVYYFVPREKVNTPSTRINGKSIHISHAGEFHSKLYPMHFEGKIPKSSTTSPTNPETVPKKKTTKAIDVRLPTAVKPTKYLLRLQPLINGNFTIFGYAEITIDVLEATSNVTLHIKDIITKNETITVRRTDDVGGPGVMIDEHLYDQERDFYTANLDEELEVGVQYVIAMEYEGYLNDQLDGFYRSQYTKEDGTLTWLAATQFEPTDARKAFPCFDEPAMKAQFDVYLAREINMSSISNMPLIETIPFETDPDWVWDHFDTSLAMSTYLVAFIVSDFTFLNSTFNDHVLFRVWAREGAIDQAEYAREAGPAILNWYEEYFNIPFPLPKQDMIAIPDFSAGAMENWGLITYRETALLYDPVLSSASNKERVAYVVAHELAHQWFGDLVTMEWWTDLWLNEGFASYMEYLGTDSFEPSWNMLDQFVTRDLQAVFALDCLESSHPISVQVGHPDEINQLFDSISYSKGASIIRMMNFFLTEPTFRIGLTNYLNNAKYGNANQDDLWEALTAQGHTDGTLPADVTVKTIMDTWTLQMGYPVINVTLNGDGTATLAQERFLLVKNSNSTDTHDYKWWVPVTFATQENPDFLQTQATEWIPDTEETMTISGLPGPGNWVIFNVQQTGYYRVNYEPSNWQLIVEQLINDFTVVNLRNRAQVIDDALDLARAGQLSYDIALSINSYLANETEYVPWNAALSNLGYLENMFTRTGGYGPLKDYLLALLTPLYNSVGFEDHLNDSHLNQYKRVIALSWACSLGLQDCVTNSVKLYQDWMAHPENMTIISPNLKSTVYCTALAEGGEEEWDFAWNQYLTTNLGAEKEIILATLGCSKKPWILSRYLEMAFIEGSGIRKQDSTRVFGAVADNDIGRDLAWNYLQENVDLITSYGHSPTILQRLTKYVSKKFITKIEKEEVDRNKDASRRQPKSLLVFIYSKPQYPFQSFTGIDEMVETVTYEFTTNSELDELIQFKKDHINELGTATRSIDQSIERTVNNIAWMDDYYNVIVAWLQDHGYGNKIKHRSQRRLQAP